MGAAYDVFGNGKTVVRGGWGMYRAYDSLQSNSYTGPAQTALGSAFRSCNQGDPACATWESVATLAQPPPIFGVSGLGTGLKSVTVMQKGNDLQPLVYSYSLNINQALPGKFSMELSYVGNKNYDGQAQVNTNAVPLGALFNAPCNIVQTQCTQLYRPYENYNGITSSVTAGYGRYDSFQASLRGNYGFMTLQANYTFSKGLSTATGANLFGSFSDYGQKYTYGVSPLNRAQALSLAYVFNLPNMKGGNALARGAVNGWQISGITQVESGLQIINTGNAANNFNLQIGGTNQDAAHLYGVATGDLTLFPVLSCNPTSGLTGTLCLNPNCFKASTKGVLGNAGMPYIPGPMFWNTDLSVLKNFKIKERQNLQFRFAFFNPLNHALTSFTNGDPNLKVSFNDQGQIITGTTCQTTGPCNEKNTFGQATYVTGGRVIELGLKYSF